jgi:hypothetical protein
MSEERPSTGLVPFDEAGDDQYGSIVKLLMLSAQRADEMASLRKT